ncbi:MAG: hypothetical protein JO291_15375 [Acidimicrobiia bacterium]|nr:hypothetical protein [Acidimicrobiia bacterium]
MKKLRGAALAAASTVVVCLAVVAPGNVAGASTPRNKPGFTGGQQLTGFGGVNHTSLASNGSTTLVVYQVPGGGSASEIWGRIMSADSKSIGSPFLIAAGNVHSHTDPDVAWNGSSWLVVYEEELASFDSDVIGEVVSKTGSVGAPMRIADTGAKEIHPSVAAGADGQWAVAWDSDEDSGNYLNDIYVNRVSAAGVVLDGLGIRLSRDTTSNKIDDHNPDIAWNGSKYMVVWEAATPYEASIGMNVFGRAGVVAYDFAGTIEDGTPSYPSLAPSIASDGKKFMVAFEHTTASTGVDIGVAEVEPLNGGYNVSTKVLSKSAGNEQDPAIAFNGTYLVVWQDRHRTAGGDLYGARVRPGPSVIDTTSFLVTQYYATNLRPALTSGTSKANTFGISWEAGSSASSTAIIGYGVTFAAK